MKKKQNKGLHQIYLNSMQDVDKELIERFIRNAINHEPIDGNDAFDIACLLEALISGASNNINMTATVRKAMGMTRKSKEHQLGSDAIRVGGIAWNIVKQKVEGEITRAQGIKEFGKLNTEVDPHTLKRWFDALVPKVELHLEKIENMNKLLEKLNGN
jgi:hypothetical protein